MRDPVFNIEVTQKLLRARKERGGSRMKKVKMRELGRNKMCSRRLQSIEYIEASGISADNCFTART